MYQPGIVLILFVHVLLSCNCLIFPKHFLNTHTHHDETLCAMTVLETLWIWFCKSLCSSILLDGGESWVWVFYLRNYPPEFGKKLFQLFSKLITDKKGMPAVPAVLPSAEETFSGLTFDDVWAEANMTSVCHWLRGGRTLEVPLSFRPLLPKRLWSM